jgi:phage FluMu protein Com
MKTKARKIKNLKPVSLDAYLEYKCPECGISHWLSLKESQTKGFKVVCVCDTIFMVKPIEDIRISYKEQEKINSVKTEDKANKDDYYVKCLKVLSQYGFSEDEMGDIIKQTIASSSDDNDIVSIVKICIQKFGEQNG